MKTKKEIWKTIHEEFSEIKKKANIQDPYSPESDNYNLMDDFERIYTRYEQELKEAIEREKSL